MAFPNTQMLALRIRGRSMEPTFFDGDLVQVSPVKIPHFIPGQIYGFRRGSEIILHRCRGSHAGLILFQGDRQPLPESIPPYHVLWQVERILERRKIPAVAQIVLGMATYLDHWENLHFPRHTCLLWPWAELVDFAQKQRLLNTFAFALLRSRLRVEVSEQWRKILLTPLYQSEILWQRLEQCASRIREILPAAKFLKGYDLAPRLYPHPYLRPMRDLDLIVPNGEFARAQKQFLRLGFRYSGDTLAYLPHANQVQFHDPDTGIEIDLLQSPFLGERYAFRTQDFFQDYSEEMEFIYLAAHGATHWGSHGIYYLDLLRYSEQYPLRAKILLQLAKEKRCLLSLALAESILTHWWNRPPEWEIANQLSKMQRIRLAVIQESLQNNFAIPMQSLGSRAMQALLFDRGKDLIHFYFDKRRLAMHQEPRFDNH